MVRGCQKKIIYLKNTQSKIFEEAYFVIRDKGLYEKADECDMVREANRILEESIAYEGKKKFKFLLFLRRYALPFFIGMTIGIALTVIIIKTI